MGNPALKRAVDAVAAALSILLLLPLFAAIAVAVWVSMGRPVFFRQRRIGLGNRPFEVVKFRTMPVAPPGTLSIPDESRLPFVGKWLRKTSLDELPQLYNVLRGDMSLVGPRPLLVEYLPFYGPKYLRRHEVRPGLTGPAQIAGRHTLKFSQRLEMDVQYVDQWTLGMDFRILLQTALRLIRKPDGLASGVTLSDIDDLGFSVALPEALGSRPQAGTRMERAS